MRIPRRFLALLYCVAFLSLATDAQTPQPSQPPPDPTERPEAFAVIDAYLDSVQACHHTPALSAGIVLGDNLAWSKGYGTIDLQHTVPASPQTVFTLFLPFDAVIR
jgi:CubicO group peptidase (beta-lactamase class C family)